MLPVNCGSHSDYQNFVVTNISICLHWTIWLKHQMIIHQSDLSYVGMRIEQLRNIH